MISASNQIVVRVPSASETSNNLLQAAQTSEAETQTLELALTRDYLRRLDGCCDHKSQTSSDGDRSTTTNSDKKQRRHRRNKRKRKPDRRLRQAKASTSVEDEQPEKEQQHQKKQQQQSNNSRLTRPPLIEPGPLLSNESSTLPLGYFLLAPRLGERTILEWRRRLHLHQHHQQLQQQQQQQQSQQHEETPNANPLMVSGARFRPRLSNEPVQSRPRTGVAQKPDVNCNQKLPQTSETSRQETAHTISNQCRYIPWRAMTARPATAASASQQSRRLQQQSNGELQSKSQPTVHHTNSNNNRPTRQQQGPGPIPFGPAARHQRLQHSGSGSAHRPRFSPYTPPLSSAVPTSSRSRRTRHATVSADADITDPRIYPTELSSSRSQQAALSAAMSRSYDGTFFAAYGAGPPRGRGPRGEFVIHPEWLSESVSIEQLRISERPLITPTSSVHQQSLQLHQQRSMLQGSGAPGVTVKSNPNWPKRCKSAPSPPQQQYQQPNSHQPLNPITWQ